jgi:hypothetical protein
MVCTSDPNTAVARGDRVILTGMGLQLADLKETTVLNAGPALAVTKVRR